MPFSSGLATMSFDVFIFGQPDLQLYPRLDVLADDLFKLLAPVGWVGAVQALGSGWHIDLCLEDEDNLGQEQWVDQLVRFLRAWGVPSDTCFTIRSQGDAPEIAFRRVEVYEQ